MTWRLGIVFFVGGLPTALSQLPEFTSKLRDELWEKAEKEVKGMSSGDYTGNTKYSCSSGTWGDGPQCNQWDAGFSPCWPSAMTISASWDIGLMAKWSWHMAMEFGVPNRGMLAPGVNLARYPWNGRLGEYMAGEDPYFGARMVETMVTAFRETDKPPLQTVKHYIPNTIEKGRMDYTEVVDERTLFEVYYPPFDAAVQAGMSAVMCSYNVVRCTSGLCDTGAAYACANHDTLEKHLKGVMGFKGIVISDWDATKCQDKAAKSGGCSAGAYIDGKYAATGGLDLEMPACQSLGGGFTNKTQAIEKATRTRWAYLVQGREFDVVETGENKGWFSDEEVHDDEADNDKVNVEQATESASSQSIIPKGTFCCYWPTGTDSCNACKSLDDSITMDKCFEEGTNTWCKDGKGVAASKSKGQTGKTPEPSTPNKEPTASEPTPAPDCETYLSNDGCAWTMDFSCKGQLTGNQGAAQDDGSMGYHCCCELGNWKKVQGAARAEVYEAATSESSDSSSADSSVNLPDEPYCCYWPQQKDACSICVNPDTSVSKSKCVADQSNQWCEPKSRALAQGAPNQVPAKDSSVTQAAHTRRLNGNHQGSIERNLKDKNKTSSNPILKYMCPFEGKDNYNQKCRLDLAAQIIAESAVVLKNKGGVLPLSKTAKVALVGEEACAEKPLAIAGGSGWNGMACQEQPYINVEDGIDGIGGDASCDASPSSADVILIVVTPEEACEGADRSTLQLSSSDTKLIQKHSKSGKPVVVAMNAPGPMITNTWDEDIDALIITWLPGTQNGHGIARALYAKEYEASGRLPFTFPKCSTKTCSKKDEFDGSIPLGPESQSKDLKHWTLSDKALIGYRWYHAKKIEPNYPFGFGLFAYGSATVKYYDATAKVDDDGVAVSCQLSQDGDRAGLDVPQLYLKFPSSIPGDPEIKPEWVLKGFQKVMLKPKKPNEVVFKLTIRDFSYWDDSKGMSKWVCASDGFVACVGANARDAVVDEKASSCVEFIPTCPGTTAKLRRAELSDKFLTNEDGSLPSQVAQRWGATVASSLVALVALAAATLRLQRSRCLGVSGECHARAMDQEPLAAATDSSACGM